MVTSWQASQTTSEASVAVERMDVEERDALRGQATLYNELLAAGEDVNSRGDVLPYAEQLALPDADMACRVEIPSIGVQLPVCHGTSEGVLSMGVGHVEGTSLPVGGPSTHCVLSAHSAMAGARLFDDIRELRPGDGFVLWTLGEPIAYEVTGSEVVLPEDVGSLSIAPGEDLCTLVTCTPYGVNSHRLLVHARRCAYEEARGRVVLPLHVGARARPLLFALVGLVVVCLLFVLASRRRATRTGHGSGLTRRPGREGES